MNKYELSPPTLGGRIAQAVGPFLRLVVKKVKPAPADAELAPLKALIRKHGIANVTGIVADMVGDLDMAAPEGSQLQRDYEFAQQILGAAASAVDLYYDGLGVTGSRTQRNEKKSQLLADIVMVRP